MSEKLTAKLLGVGGLIKATPDDFLVEELPAYLPSGEGTHTFLFIEKRGLNTEDALAALCRALGVRRDAAGAAGMKDRQAVTRQWVSVPDVAPEAALALTLPGVTVLSAARHGNKLRTGHLRGNRFHVTIRGIQCEQPIAIARAEAIIAALVETGLPNFYGPQRFGARGDNASRGRALLVEGRECKLRVGRSERRLLISAFQSELFNRYLSARLRDGLLRTAILGDVLRKRESGGLFVAEDLADANERLRAGTLDVTGPMYGSEMKAPPPGTPAQVREDETLRAAEVSVALFANAGPLAEGTRRPLTVPVEAPEVVPGPSKDSILLRFSLPSGAYATVLVDEVTKNQ